MLIRSRLPMVFVAVLAFANACAGFQGHMERGASASAKGDFAAAFQSYREALELAKTAEQRLEANLALAEAATQAGELEAALAAFEMAAASLPEAKPEEQARLAANLFAKGLALAEAAAAAGHAKHGLAFCVASRPFANTPEDRSALFALCSSTGDRALAQGEPDAALAAYLQAKELAADASEDERARSGMSRVYLGMGERALAQGDLEAAQGSFLSVTELAGDSPTQLAACLSLAGVQQLRQDASGSTEAYELGLDLAANDPALLGQAEGALWQAIESPPRSGAADLQVRALIRLWQRAGVLEARLQDLEGRGAAGSSSAASELVLGAGLELQGKRNEANHAYREHVGAGGRQPMALRGLIAALPDGFDDPAAVFGMLFDAVGGAAGGNPSAELLRGLASAWERTGRPKTMPAACRKAWQGGNAEIASLLALWSLDLESRQSGEKPLLKNEEKTRLTEELIEAAIQGQPGILRAMVGMLPAQDALPYCLRGIGAWVDPASDGDAVLAVARHEDLFSIVVQAWCETGRIEAELERLRNQPTGSSPRGLGILLSAWKRGLADAETLIPSLEAAKAANRGARAGALVRDWLARAYAQAGRDDSFQALVREEWLRGPDLTSYVPLVRGASPDRTRGGASGSLEDLLSLLGRQQAGPDRSRRDDALDLARTSANAAPEDAFAQTLYLWQLHDLWQAGPRSEAGVGNGSSERPADSSPTVEATGWQASGSRDPALALELEAALGSYLARYPHSTWAQRIMVELTIDGPRADSLPDRIESLFGSLPEDERADLCCIAADAYLRRKDVEAATRWERKALDAAPELAAEQVSRVRYLASLAIETGQGKRSVRSLIESVLVAPKEKSPSVTARMGLLQSLDALNQETQPGTGGAGLDRRNPRGAQ